MSMNEFRRLAAKMDQHMQQLAAQGVNDAPAIIHRMMGYVPDLHKIWVGTADDQLIALSNEFPGFYRYALRGERRRWCRIRRSRRDASGARRAGRTRETGGHSREDRGAIARIAAARQPAPATGRAAPSDVPPGRMKG